MRLTFEVDRKIDGMELAYLKIRETKIACTVEVSDEVNVDFDADGQVVGVEVLLDGPP